MSNREERLQTVSPTRLSPDELRDCLTIIEEGEAVDMDSATAEMPKALAVVVVRSSSEIVGVGAVKRKRPKYVAKVARNSGYNLDPNTHELGYVAVTESHQGKGLSKKIVTALLASTGERPLFATTSNPRMKKSLSEAEFARRGNEWPGDTGELLSLWLLE